MPKACPYVWANSCFDSHALFQWQFFEVVLQVNCKIYCVTLRKNQKMGNDDINSVLAEKGIKPTSNRILVMRELVKASHPVSLADLEISLEFSVDKASIFRVLELFSAKHIVRVIEDGSRSLKYELCGSGAHYSDQHVHFYCEQCKKTYCFEDESVPVVNIPKGFSLHDINYMMKGTCPNCNKR